MERTYTTILGQVTVTDVTMLMKRAHGQYGIYLELKTDFETKFDPANTIITIHSTDSALYDALREFDTCEEKTKYMFENYDSLIERAVNEFVNSL